MKTRRKTIPLQPHEHKLLVKLYLKRRIPIDQYENRPNDLDDFIKEWNTLSHRTDNAGDILHYMRTKRKNKLWVTFDGNHLAAPDLPDMDADETELLVAIFNDNVAAMNHGSDELAYNAEVAAIIGKEFAARTGRVLPVPDLIAKLTALRKRGLLPKAAKHIEADPDVGFTDMDDIQQAS